MKEEPKTLEEQLETIPELKKVMGDPEKKKYLLSMSVDELRNMRETLFDGHTYHITDAYRFIDGATPNDVDSFVTQHISHRLDQNRAYSNPNAIDWRMWIPVFCVVMIVAAVAIQILRSGV